MHYQMDQGKDDRQHQNTQHNIPVSVKESHQNLTTVQDLRYGNKSQDSKTPCQITVRLHQ